MKSLKITSYVILFFVSIYILGGFLLLPFIAKKELVKNLDELLTTKTKIEDIYFNPLTLDLELKNFVLLDEKEQEIIKLKRLFIDFRALKSIEKKHFHIKSVLLEGIYLNIIEEEKGIFNLAKLIKSTTNETNVDDKNENSQAILDFLISKIVLKDANIDFTRFMDKQKYNLYLKDINYTIYDFGTFKNSLSSNNLEFKINEDTNIKIAGGLKLTPFVAYGKIDIKDLKIKEIIDINKTIFNFDINKEANLNLILNYNIDTVSDFRMFLNTELLELNNLKLNQNKQEIASLNKFDLKQLSFDLNKQEINLKDLDINNLYAKMLLDKQGVNFASLIKNSGDKNSIENDKKNNQNIQNSSKKNKPWIINFQNIKLNGNFDFFDNLNNTKLTIKDIKVNTSYINIIDSKVNLKGANIETSNTNYIDNQNKLNLNSNKTNIDLDEVFVDSGKVKVSNINISKDKLVLNKEDIKMKLDLEKIDLKLSNLSIFDEISFSLSNLIASNLTLEDKNNNFSLSSKSSKLKLENFLLNKQNEISIKQSELYDTKIDFFDANSSFDINTKNTNLKIIDFNLKKDLISINQILLKEPKIDIINIDSKLQIEAKNINLALKKLISKENFFKIEKTNLDNPHLSIILPKNSNKDIKTKEEKISVNEVEEKTNNKKSRLNIGPVYIDNMTFDFEDKNLAIPFKTTISKLKGEISEIKNKKQSSSNLEIKGVVDEYGVAKITGIVNPNNIKILTDINMKFQNISIKNFTPYTAKFVGRTIKDGKLELDLNYNITQSNLKAKNSIIIKKIALGEKVESQDAISLPLDLAITLLEDSSNTIDINLPISGNVDDPQFSVAAIVWKAFINLVTKAITSPFSLIGSLFNFSEDELKSVSFDLKQSEITPIQQETLDKIAIILKSKSDFAISFSPSFDEKNEKEKVAIQRADNIKSYLINEKSINTKQVIIDTNIKKSNSNIDLNIKQIQSKN